MVQDMAKWGPSPVEKHCVQFYSDTFRRHSHVMNEVYNSYIVTMSFEEKIYKVQRSYKLLCNEIN